MDHGSKGDPELSALSFSAHGQNDGPAARIGRLELRRRIKTRRQGCESIDMRTVQSRVDKSNMHYLIPLEFE